MAHKFSPERKHLLDAPERQVLLPARKTLERLGFTPGDWVADIGCGTGYFALPLAELVGSEGRVWGFDLQEELVTHAAARAEASGLTQLQISASDENHIGLDDKAVDSVLLAAVVHELDDPPRFLAELLRVLRPGGFLRIVEWEKRDMEMGPPAHERIDPDELACLLATQGFGPAGSFHLGEAHYGLVANAP